MNFGRPKRISTQQKRDKQLAFLEAYCEFGNITLAAKVVDIPVPTIYAWRYDRETKATEYVDPNNPELEEGFTFDQEMKIAYEIYRDGIREKVYSRVLDGLEQHLHIRGNPQYQVDEDGALRLDEEGNPIPVIIRTHETPAFVKFMNVLPEVRGTGGMGNSVEVDIESKKDGATSGIKIRFVDSDGEGRLDPLDM